MDQMASFLTEILQLKIAPGLDSARVFVENLKNNTETFTTAQSSRLNKAGNATIQSSVHMDVIEHIDGNSINMLSAVVLLRLQERFLSEGMFEAYITTCGKILQNIDNQTCQVLYSEVTTLSYLIAHIACMIGKPKLVLPGLRHLAMVLSPQGHCLTPVHTDFLQACIKGYFYSLAIEFLQSMEIVEVNPLTMDISMEDVLRYFYYAGICWIAKKEYARAMHAFLTVIVSPSQPHCLSKIVEESIKKCKLISLLASPSPSSSSSSSSLDYGKKFEVPKSASTAVIKFANEAMTEYDEIVTQYQATSTTNASLEKAIEAGKEILDRDLNYGLARQLLSGWRKQRLYLLAQTFVTIPLPEVALTLGFSSSNNTAADLSATIAFIMQCVQGSSSSSSSSSSFYARYDVDKNLIYFEEEQVGQEGQDAGITVKKKSPGATMQAMLLAQRLDQGMHRIVEMNEYMKALQKEIVTSQAYVMKVTANNNNNTSFGGMAGGTSGGRSLGGGPGLSSSASSWGGGGGGHYHQQHPGSYSPGRLGGSNSIMMDFS